MNRDTVRNLQLVWSWSTPPGPDDDLLVYGWTFAVPVSVRVSAAVSEGAVAAHGRLRHQACDDRLCLAPATLILDLTARVESAPVP